ncbi:hypothetical protein N7462_004926 [Penicillium macrosclerotiorum]|uniref:uncharacterized protein n=1 Tax=Penicillium macrosclerotiorum TaxID=303699 RepID=UPI002546F1B3|nr:uncharacterized protein N7462_004926 [Penicillium macrosclerotiorum]KAJ5690534.1 hypothetical protein N7462_004926 [Penicillium macrosclerotiorum]
MSHDESCLKRQSNGAHGGSGGGLSLRAVNRVARNPAPPPGISRAIPFFLPQDTTPRASVTESNFKLFKSDWDFPFFSTPLLAAPRPLSRPSSSSGNHNNTDPPSNLHGNHLPWSSFSQFSENSTLLSLASPAGCIPTTLPYNHSFESFAQEPDLWAEPDLSFACSDWNLLPVGHPVSYSANVGGVHSTVNNMEYGMPSTFTSLSDSGSNEPPTLHTSLLPSSSNSQDENYYASPISQIPSSASTSLSSPATSQSDEVLSRVDSSRVEKRRLNTLAARRCRQRRVDRMKSLEDELESIRRERDELRLKVSKLEGETEALKGLLTRKSK